MLPIKSSIELQDRSRTTGADWQDHTRLTKVIKRPLVELVNLIRKRF